MQSGPGESSVVPDRILAGRLAQHSCALTQSLQYIFWMQSIRDLFTGPGHEQKGSSRHMTEIKVQSMQELFAQPEPPEKAETVGPLREGLTEAQLDRIADEAMAAAGFTAKPRKERSFRFDWTQAIRGDRSLSPGARLLAHTFADHMNHKQQPRHSWPGIALLALEMNVSPRTVREYKKELVEAGFLVRAPVPGASNRVRHVIPLRGSPPPAVVGDRAPTEQTTYEERRKK